MDLLKLIWVKNYNGLDFNLSAMPFSGEVKIMAKLAVLLVNLGSPEKPEVKSVRSYLDQFLMDPYVIQLPWWLRRLLVSLFVLPTRPKSSAPKVAAFQAQQSWPEFQESLTNGFQR